jgi:hypothetical protein
MLEGGLIPWLRWLEAVLEHEGSNYVLPFAIDYRIVHQLKTHLLVIMETFEDKSCSPDVEEIASTMSEVLSTSSSSTVFGLSTAGGSCGVDVVGSALPPGS